MVLAAQNQFEKQQKANRSIFREHSHGASLGTVAARRRRRRNEEASKADGGGGGLARGIYRNAGRDGGKLISGDNGNDERSPLSFCGAFKKNVWFGFDLRGKKCNRRKMVKTHLWAAACVIVPTFLPPGLLPSLTPVFMGHPGHWRSPASSSVFAVVPQT